jgi:hypothetical protein
MIDNPGQAERLLTRLQAVLPVPARMTPELAATLRTPETATEIPTACSIIALHYAGDEGGIVCGLDVATATGNAVYTSITHPRFDPRLPLAREIAAYQKHRVKRLRRQPPMPG